MKCWEFRERVIDLACDRPMEQGLRERAHAHAERCESCGQQLSAQRHLNRELQVYAEETGKLHASSRVRARVREEMRGAVAASPAPVVPISAYRKPANRLWLLAAAAVFAAICGLSILLWQGTSTPNRKATDDITDSIHPSPTQEIRDPRKTTPPPVQRDAAGPPLERLSKKLAGSGRRTSPRASRPSENLASNAETVSEFVPLTLAADEKAIENGTIVRIKAPRAQLVAMGLPLRIENEAETINADIMLGDNGVAYAIRVVR